MKPLSVETHTDEGTLTSSVAYPLRVTSESDVITGRAFDLFRDRLRAQADLSRTNWFRVGGPAQWLFRPENTDDLSAFLKLLPMDYPVTMLGVGSNVIVRDGGIDGVVIKLGRGFADLEVERTSSNRLGHPLRITAGAGALAFNTAMFACEEAVAGLEFLSGIPGTIGGVVRMNAGAYGADASQVVVEAQVVLRDGTITTYTRDMCGFSYRHSQLPENAIVTRVVMQGQLGKKDDIAERIREINEEREFSQPVRARTGGSTFKNPPHNKAWELIDRAGCRGLRIGDAQISEKHCNFMINMGEATAADLENLGEEVRRRVREVTNVDLEWEIKRIGKRLP